MTSSVDDASFQKTEREFVAALAHMKKLRRLKNRLCSPLLRLPVEIIVRIISFIMAELDSFSNIQPWIPIYSTCYHINRIMCRATDLWWRVNCAYTKTAHLMFLRSQANPQVILSDLREMENKKFLDFKYTLDFWRTKRGFNGNRLHTLEFYGSLWCFERFSWIFERSLPRVRHLTINIVDPFEDNGTRPSWEPADLELPTDMPLQVLDLRNIVLPWSSHFPLFNRLRELSLDLRDCGSAMAIPEDELFGIFDASPQLERLSLLQVGHEVPVRNGRQLPPKRILQFPKLTSLSLENDPTVVKYTLEYMDLPVIKYLKIRSFISWDVAHTVDDLFFPNDRLPVRLFPNPPTLAVNNFLDLNGRTIGIDIGSVGLVLCFPLGQGERGRRIIMSHIPQLVPSSLVALKLDLEHADLEEQGWRDFFISHAEIRSIECNEHSNHSTSKALWKALSATGEEGVGVPCPGLESISMTLLEHAGDVSLSALADCLQSRRGAGFKLGRLRMLDDRGYLADIEGFHLKFCPLVEKAEACKTGIRQQVRSILRCEPCVD